MRVVNQQKLALLVRCLITCKVTGERIRDKIAASKKEGSGSAALYLWVIE
jgi:hypothetical protein